MLNFFIYVESNNISTFLSTNATATTSSQQRKTSPVLVHFMKITGDEYICKICKVATPLKVVKVKDKSSSMITCKLYMKIYNYECKLRHKILLSNACYHIFLVFIYHSMKIRL